MYRRPQPPRRDLFASLDALLWGTQAAFLSPALALILVNIYGASAAEVGLILAIYSAGGFIASLVIPSSADRRGDYLAPMLVCALLTLSLAVALAYASTLTLAAIALVVLGGPASVGTSLLFAHLMQSGANTAVLVNTRAAFSFAWVSGPPVATALIGWLGTTSVLGALAVVAVLNALTTIILMRRSRPEPAKARAYSNDPASRSSPPAGRHRLVVIIGAFALAQATNAASVAVLALFVTVQLHLPVLWAGVAAGLAASLEVPALLVQGRLSERYSELTLLLTACVAGLLYYTGMIFVTSPMLLLALQALNAWFFAAFAGVGLAFFQHLIPRPGLANGIYANTRQIGSILAGPVIALAASPTGYAGLFGACAAMIVVAAALAAVSRTRPREPRPSSAARGVLPASETA